MCADLSAQLFEQLLSRRPQIGEAGDITTSSSRSSCEHSYWLALTQAPANDWLLANASACISCGFRLRNARSASDCVWMETRLN